MFFTAIHPKDLSRLKTDDHWLRRFIAHSENDVTATLNMMWTALTWRKEQGANGNILVYYRKSVET